MKWTPGDKAACVTCRHWHDLARDHKGVIGACLVSALVYSQDADSKGRHRRTLADQWCGQWEPKPKQ